MADIELRRNPPANALTLRGKKTFITPERYEKLLNVLTKVPFFIDGATGSYATLDSNGAPRIFIKEEAARPGCWPRSSSLAAGTTMCPCLTSSRARRRCGG